MDCVFCKISQGMIPARKEYEDEDIVGFWDIKPSAPVHIVFVPKKHIASLGEVAASDQDLLGKLQLVMRNVAVKLKISEAYKIFINNGRFQEVPHLHYHLLGGFDEKGGI